MFLPAAEPSDATTRICKGSRDTHGFVMNLTHLWSWRPDLFDAFTALRNQLTSQSTLTKRDQAIVVCAMASQLGDSYCSLAWGGKLAGDAGADVAGGVLLGDDSRLDATEQALARWARQVTRDPNATAAADVDALRAAGYDDAQIFAVTLFVALRIAFSTVNDALGARPDRELIESVPEAVRAAVTYGRPATS